MAPKMGVPRSCVKRDKSSNKLFKIRMERGLSQRALAEQAGITRNSLLHFENGDTVPNLETVQKIAAALNFEITELF